MWVDKYLQQGTDEAFTYSLQSIRPSQDTVQFSRRLRVSSSWKSRHTPLVRDKYNEKASHRPQRAIAACYAGFQLPKLQLLEVKANLCNFVGSMMQQHPIQEVLQLQFILLLFSCCL